MFENKWIYGPQFTGTWIICAYFMRGEYRISSEGGDILLLYLGHFGHFAPFTTLFIHHFLGYKIVARMIKILFRVLDFMQILQRIWWSKQGKYYFRRSKTVTREHEGVQLITFHYNTKGKHTIVQKYRKQSFKESGNWIWRAFLSNIC